MAKVTLHRQSRDPEYTSLALMYLGRKPSFDLLSFSCQSWQRKEIHSDYDTSSGMISNKRVRNEMGVSQVSPSCSKITCVSQKAVLFQNSWNDIVPLENYKITTMTLVDYSRALGSQVMRLILSH